MADTAATTELVITRVFDAPRELVYRAFTDPDQLAQWFGPVGFSVPRDTVDIDARVGGHQRFTMVSDHDPAMSSTVNATFTEVVENELLVGTETAEGVPGVAEGTVFSLRVEFHDEDGRTRLVLRQGPYTAEMEGMARAGWLSSFGKLDTLLAG
ncbi:SRPBCC family protein [Micromonospora echinofusca]|uniref:SRPBCC domain-containing protein n=1 Tax=Micromonospora echinofusca TaxID=47858 RepID=A0ABS3VW43_MICEH|nr:SRPBCC domain-containing protein [Micromonospora echinofusca]MBO4208764.1 SRPBCC domain-containing protein [Micromonospora echinofusca]